MGVGQLVARVGIRTRKFREDGLVHHVQVMEGTKDEKTIRIRCSGAWVHHWQILLLQDDEPVTCIACLGTLERTR